MKMAYFHEEFTEIGFVGLFHCSCLTHLEQRHVDLIKQQTLSNAEQPNQVTGLFFQHKTFIFRVRWHVPRIVSFV